MQVESQNNFRDLLSPSAQLLEKLNGCFNNGHIGNYWNEIESKIVYAKIEIKKNRIDS